MDADVWLSTIIQIGHKEAPVKHAITALASLHESLEPDEASSAIRPSEKYARISAQMLALKHYTAAIKSVQMESLPTSSSSRPDTVLTLCILFVCFEQFRSGDAACLLHLAAGFRLLYCWRNSTTAYSKLQEFSRPTLDLINNRITPILQRLRVQFCLCMDSRHSLKDIGVPVCLPLPQIPFFYSSLDFARKDYDRIMNYILSSLEREETTQDENSKPALSTLLRQWKKALDSFESPKESSILQECTIKLLNLYYHISIIISDCYNPKTESIFDKYTKHFRDAVDLAEDIADIWKINSQDFSLLFSFDLGITPPMFFVASRCRHPLIRRRAVDLMLHTPFYHGAWQDRYSGFCAKKIIEIEENAAGFLMDDINVAEQYRIRKVSADLQETQSKVSMSYVRWPFDVDSPVETTSVELNI